MRMAIALILGLAAASVLGAGAADAQTQPKAFSWERKTDRLLQPKRVDRLDGAYRTLGGASRLLSLPKNRDFSQKNGLAPSSAPPHAAQYDGLDSNRDGFVSRDEYVAGRSRPPRAGARGLTRNNVRQARLNSRFRGADLNRDGRLSAGELQRVRNRRF